MSFRATALANWCWEESNSTFNINWKTATAVSLASLSIPVNNELFTNPDFAVLIGSTGDPNASPKRYWSAFISSHYIPTVADVSLPGEENREQMFIRKLRPPAEPTVI
ncbi:uncharacterized protein PgNI_07966 [Pyricularia grisea]|uniref:Uncharacterized protein n=1 Tax=Pyricularia grisea TaxID=148305 RepID=A0A6P8B1M0_PYRGI|nr:uncharacterized protein PgNI_07966 [Pyricularia grisea]TLD08613.1 hypothetical protein PgNI_07966 [Pyricularia grisea]